jgi:predicted Zn-dependent peptidase
MSSLKPSLSGLLATALLCVSSLAQAIPEIQNWHTANGVPVYFIAARELPMVDAQILFRAGSVRDGERPGLAQLTNGLLEEGAGDWSADTIADRLGPGGCPTGHQFAARLGIGGAAQPHRPTLSATRRRNRRPLAEGTELRSRGGGAGAPANADCAPGTRPVARRHRPGRFL